MHRTLLGAILYSWKKGTNEGRMGHERSVSRPPRPRRAGAEADPEEPRGRGLPATTALGAQGDNRARDRDAAARGGEGGRDRGDRGHHLPGTSQRLAVSRRRRRALRRSDRVGVRRRVGRGPVIHSTAAYRTVGDPGVELPWSELLRTPLVRGSQNTPSTHSGCTRLE